MPFKHLFTPIMLGKVEVRNRIAMAPIGTGVYNQDDTVPDRTIPYVEARAKGGVGLIITQFGRASKYQTTHLMGVFEDRFIPGLRQYSEAVHRHGARVFLQIAALGGKDPKGSYAPSAIESPLYTVPPKELTAEQIEEIIGEFIQAARRAQEAGFDGVELHGAHSYLIGQFISPHANRRTDAYGGDFERRMRVPVEIVRGIRKVCGEDFPVGFKFSAYEEIPNGVDHELAPRIAERMAREGIVYVHAASTASTIEALSDYPSVPPMYMKRNTLLFLAENLKGTARDLPIMATGSIVSPRDAEEILAEEKADMVAVGRALLADPEWPNKAREGARIRPCIRCNVCHYEAVFKWHDIACTVNPYLAKEAEEALIPAERSKRVMVIGGGPAGMVTALVASQRGHRVALYEQREELGGMLVPGSNPPFKVDVRDLLAYYRREIADSTVEVRTGVEVTPEWVAKEAPEVLVVTLGGVSAALEVPGLDRKPVRSAVEVLRDRDAVHGDRVVVVGGGDVGCETALYLRQAGKDVTVVEMLGALMAENEMKNNTMVLEAMLKEAGVKARTDTVVKAITADGVMVEAKDGTKETLPADEVVVAMGIQPSTEQVASLRAVCEETYTIGDCVEPARIFEAVHEGDRIGRTI